MWRKLSSSRVIATIRPYLAFTLDVIASKSGPEVTSSTVPVTGVMPALTRPRTSLDCRVTLGLFRSRLPLPEAGGGEGHDPGARRDRHSGLAEGGHGHVLLLRDRLFGVAASHLLLLSDVISEI